MKLYHSPTSPYVRKVMVTLDLTGQLGEVESSAGLGEPETRERVLTPEEEARVFAELRAVANAHK